MSTHSYKDLLAQREALEQQIAAARKTEVADAVQKIKGLIEAFGLTQDDVFPAAKQKTKNARLALWLQNIVTQPQARLGPVEESLRIGSKIKIVLSLRFESGLAATFYFSRLPQRPVLLAHWRFSQHCPGGSSLLAQL